MKIGIIGASLAGLVAGEKLAKAGHDVTVIEKSRVLGGRLATRHVEEHFFDYGVPYLTAQREDFTHFIKELADKNIAEKWTDHLQLFDGSVLHEVNPNQPEKECYAGLNGINNVASYLKRWVDIKSAVRAGGLTYIGADRVKKRAWMINLTDISVFECDAVIIATPATEAYGMLNTAQDETPVKRVIRVVDELRYEPCYAVMASYREGAPGWNGIECEEGVLRWLGNESSKSKSEQAHIVIQSTGEFARKNHEKDDEEIEQVLLERAGDIADPWLGQPEETQLHFWKYFNCKNPIDEYFLEVEMEDAPLALIGDYMNGTTVEDAYESGLYLAHYWIDKFEMRAVGV